MKNQRARSKDEKQKRKEDILNAALQLLLQKGKIASVQQIATASKVAKGTIYLYFGSKEEIYLTLFQQQWDPLFVQINNAVTKKNSQISDITKTIARYVVESKFFLPLMAACSGMLGRTADKEVVRSYQQILAKNLEHSSQILHEKFGISHQDGIQIFLRTYAIIFGMWDVVYMAPNVKQVFAEEKWTAFPSNYEKELHETLHILWAGMLR
ncbi:TetR family transcriptional regulator [Candidatus Uabimicrobium amorphum]|nr:TetR family transcriptional regulator [Candidatus Uabimicrobium amorphum]